jgi:hypothetical protein
MAQFVFTNNTYAGEVLAGYMSRSLLEADSVSRGLITPFTNCKARQVLLLVDDEIILQDPNAQFTDQGTTATQTERYLDPITYEFMKEQEWEALTQSWEQDQLKAGALQDYDGIVDLSGYLVDRYLKKIQIANERLYWLGKQNVTEVKFTPAYPGLLNQIAADPLTRSVLLETIGGANPASFTASAITIGTYNGVANSASVTVASTANLSNGDVVTVNNTWGTFADTSGAGQAGRPTSWTGYGVISNTNPQAYVIQVIDATHFQLLMNYNEWGNRSVYATFSGTASVSGTAATICFINASNVLAVLSSVYAQVPPSVRSKADFNIMVPEHVARAYAIAQANKATNVLNAFVDKKVMDFLGDKLQVMEQWQANVILAACASNLFLGVDLMSDTSRLMTVFKGDYTLDMVVRMRARMKSATNYAFAFEILYVSA